MKKDLLLLLLCSLGHFGFCQRQKYIDNAIAALAGKVYYQNIVYSEGEYVKPTFTDTTDYFVFAKNASPVPGVKASRSLSIDHHIFINDPITGYTVVKHLMSPYIIGFKRPSVRNKTCKVVMRSLDHGVRKGVMKFISDSSFSLEPGWSSAKEYYKIAPVAVTLR